jgi:integrase
VLVIAEGTGRRIGAVRQLRYEDLRLQEGETAKIQWPADTDKKGRRWLTPITPEVRRRLLEVIRRRPGIGSAPIFPAPRDRAQPVSDEVLRHWLRAVLAEAGLPRLPHEAFHGIRRKWATERKHLPDVDVAKAGGWRSLATMKRSYQQADDIGVLEAVLEPRKLRERRQ